MAKRVKETRDDWSSEEVGGGGDGPVCFRRRLAGETRVVSSGIDGLGGALLHPSLTFPTRFGKRCVLSLAPLRAPALLC